MGDSEHATRWSSDIAGETISQVVPATPALPSTVFVRARRNAMPLVPRLPGSKYYTLRYLLNALLAYDESVVRFPALSDDTAVLVAAMRALGATAQWERDTADPSSWALRVMGCAGKPRSPASGVLSVGNAGAVLRLLLGVGALLPEVRFETDHPMSLGRRPNADLLAALVSLGIEVEAQGTDGLLPITLRGGPPHGGAVSISGARSSQYLSALLYLAPMLQDGLEITVPDTLRSAPLVRATLRALAAAGIQFTVAGSLHHFDVPGSQTYRAGTYEVPADGPSAAALIAAALTLGVPLRLERLPAAEDDIQALIAALDAFGAPLSQRPSLANGGVLALTTSPYMRGARVDGDGCIDSVPVLAAAACFAEGETRFENVATLRLKESDRIEDLCAELRRAGCDVDPLPDVIVVRGRPGGIAGGVTVDGHDDHRLVQALAVVALRSRDGLTITGADAVAKSYPWFFEDLERMGAEVVAM
ncbi:MAG TPA: 3-phosphoshikimate 1-carboxyvinyltransferase [Ktedonobacterales bacterium]|nr:3-phosphoshikimate 1-carboxyvinyltransferase [Ktedonobacterales bacterium]